MAIKSKSARICLIVLAAILLALALFCLVLVLLFDNLFAKLVAKNLPLIPGSASLDSWLKPSVPVYFTVRLFNLTNKEELLNGQKPNFTVIGPYVYREKREKFDWNFSSEDPPKLLRFKHRIFYHFVPELSNGSPEDATITSVDLFYLETLARGQQYLATAPFVTLNAHQFMWDYSPQVLQWAKYLGAVDKDNVGFFASNNGTNVIEYLVDTGVDDISKIGWIYEVNGKRKMDIWDFPEANMLNGSDGSLAPPGLSVGSEVTFHVADICRSSTSYAVARKPTINREDVDVIVFSPASPTPDDPVVQWRTKMFCKGGVECPPKGLISLRPCLRAKGVQMPMYMSQPFFMSGDPKLREAVNGLPEPRPEEHATWVHIEPTTGFVLEAFKRVQFNVLLENTDSSFGKMQGPFYYPVAWIMESAIADAGTLGMLHSKLLGPKKMLPVILAIVGSVATLLCIMIIIILVTCARKHSSSTRSKIKGGGDATTGAEWQRKENDPVLFTEHSKPNPQA
ncbi:unnamed protein product [Calicophoron daubneyi]